MTISTNSFVTDGCVFMYDAKNPKSFLGVPTTNFLVTTSWGTSFAMGRSDRRPFASASHSSFGQLTQGTGVTFTPGGMTRIPETPVAGNPVWYVINSDPDNFSRFSPFSGFDIDDFPVLDVPYVVSCYVYIPPNITLGGSNDCPISQNNTGADWHNGPAGGVATFNSTWNFWAAYIASADSRANTSLRGGWQRIWIRFTPSTTIRNQESGSGITIDKLGGYMRPNLVGQTQQNYLFLSSSQMERGNFPSPYVHGTRSATESVKDLISNRTITATNIEQDSDGTFLFNRAGANLSFSTAGMNFADAQTIILVLKPTENDSNRRNPYNHEYAGYGTITHEPGGAFNYYHGISGGSGATYQGTGSTFTVVQNETAMIAVSRGFSTVKWYKNGVLSDSTANSYPNAVTSVSTAYIGTGYTTDYIGNIYFAALYNRQLSDEEIAQVFSSLKGKFGL